MRVGIDFGTTTSTICRLLPDGRIDSQGPIPSIAAWKNGEWTFADAAESLLASGDRTVFPVRDLKLALGRKSLRVGPNQLDTEEAVALFLKYLASRIAGSEEVEEAVIGTPVNVEYEHRKALIRAAERAGFRKVRLVYEPTSALVGATDPQTLDSRALVLVVDWGGGTLDIALVRKEGGLIREVDVDGDVHELGGSRMDHEIVSRLLETDAGLRKKVDEVDGGFERLKHEIEGPKRDILSDGNEEDSDGTRRIASHWLQYEFPLRPSLVFSVISEMADRAAQRIGSFLARSHVAPREVTHLLFAGGVCNSPVVQERISKGFGAAKVIGTSFSPQLLTGYGCVQLVKRGFSLQLSAAFGVREADDAFCEMLPAGHDLAVGAYRVAEFMVTDVLAPEALFEVGIRRHANGSAAMMSGPDNRFRSMEQLFVQAQDRPGQNKGNGGDLVRLYCGIDSTLAVKLYAESNLTGNAETKTVSGLPLCIRVGS